MLQDTELYNEVPYEQKQILDNVKIVKFSEKILFHGLSEGLKRIGKQRFVEALFLLFDCF